MRRHAGPPATARRAMPLARQRCRCAPCFRADAAPELVRLMERRCNHFNVWLVAHADLYKTARVQAVIEAVVDEFATATAGPVVAR